MSARTVYLSRLIGLYAIVVALAMLTYKQESMEAITALLGSAAGVFAVGLVGVGAGLALVLAHNVWRGGALPVMVTLTGWGSLVKGLACLFLPMQVMAVFLAQAWERFYYASPVLLLVLGFYLLYAGSFKAMGDARA